MSKLLRKRPKLTKSPSSAGSVRKGLTGADGVTQTEGTSLSPGRLRALGPSSEAYRTVKHLFETGWLHPKKERPSVLNVFEILEIPDIEVYTSYRSSVHSSTHTALQSTWAAVGNETLLFHGTQRSCLLGQASMTLCELPHCCVCRIIQSSFQIERSGSRNWLRFGKGIYTTAVSSKADDYVLNASQLATSKVMLVNRVVLGVGQKTPYNALDLRGPSSGCHSVVGEPGNDLNFSETVVYSDDAIRPAYLVVYCTPKKLSKKRVA